MGKSYQSHTFKNVQSNFYDKTSEKSTALRQSETLYYAMIHPYLTYGILAWGNSTQANLKKIIVLQKRAIRIMHKVPYNGHTEPLLKKSKILKLRDQ